MVNGQKIDHDHDTLDFSHGQWSKSTNFDRLTMVILKFWPWPWSWSWSWSKMTNFDHLTPGILKFWTWSWSKIFDHLTMTTGYCYYQLVTNLKLFSVLIDILTCLFVLPSSISIMHYRKPVLFSSSLVCIASG